MMEEQLARHAGSLCAFARSLCRDPVQAEDLMQETLLKAWANRARFELGTNLQAWLFTILRNQFYSNLRRRRLEMENNQRYDIAATMPPEQHSKLDFDDFCRALHLLPAEQREAIVLVGAGGLSYEETAAICHCAVGTVKSRVARARRQLGHLLEGSEPLPSAAAAAATARQLATMLGSLRRRGAGQVAGKVRARSAPARAVARAGRSAQPTAVGG